MDNHRQETIRGILTSVLVDLWSIEPEVVADVIGALSAADLPIVNPDSGIAVIRLNPELAEELRRGVREADDMGEDDAGMPVHEVYPWGFGAGVLAAADILDGRCVDWISNSEMEVRRQRFIQRLPYIQRLRWRRWRQRR